MNIAAFLTYIIVTAITPGPNNITAMSNGIRIGFIKGLRYNYGVFAGQLCVVTICGIFSAVLAASIPSIKPYLLVLGAGYMLYLAYKTYHSNGVQVYDNVSGTFLSGFSLQFINPKYIIYSITAMSSYILPNYTSFAIIVPLGILLAFTGFACTILWSAFGSLFVKVYAAHAKLLNTIMALLLVYCAVALFL
ncbi:MAG: LysE family transporter [Christensenellaceae bacterium]|jgi:threonine/homoserine/homoserine lactone efflux protein|nr:LysE family transporter [Christensenellaceae bacterium]